MILKLIPYEIEWLLEFDGGPFGNSDLVSFMAEISARIDQDTGEIDLGRDEREKIAAFEADERTRAIVQRVFSRPMQNATEDFFGQ